MNNNDYRRRASSSQYPPRTEEHQFCDESFAIAPNVLLPNVSWPFFDESQFLYQPTMPGASSPLQPSTSFPFTEQAPSYLTPQLRQYPITNEQYTQNADLPAYLPSQQVPRRTNGTMDFIGDGTSTLYGSQMNTMPLSEAQVGPNTLLYPNIMLQDPFGVNIPQEQALRRPMAPRSVSSILLSTATSDMWPSDTESRPSSMPDDIGGNRSDSELSSRQARRELSAAKEGNNYKCPVEGCGKLFNRSYNFRAHMETHDENRVYPFKCPLDGCDKEFRRKTDLQRHHQSVHVKEREHQCGICQKHFSRKDTLKRHQEDCASKTSDPRRTSR